MDQKRSKTKNSPMRKRALGSCSATETETTPLRKTMDGIKSLSTSRSDWRLNGLATSDEAFGRFSNNVSGERRRESSSSFLSRIEGRAKFTPVTLEITEVFSVSAADGGPSPSAPGGS